MKGQPGRNVQIDFLRFLFCVIIVLHHSRYVLGDDNCYFLGGSLAVEFFFFVSGYLLLASVQRAGTKERTKRIGSETLHFLIKRIRSFLPEFLTAWVIGFFAIALAEKYSPGELWTAFIAGFWELTLVKMSGLFIRGIDGVMWYLSALLLGSALLYPLLRKKEDLMTHLVCPLLCLFLYGYLCRAYGHPRDPTVWTGFVYKGLIRGIAGLCTGICAKMAADSLRERIGGVQEKERVHISKAGALLVTLLELFCLILPIRYMALRQPSSYDYFYMFLLFLLVILCFSGLGIENILLADGGRGNTKSRISKAANFLAGYSLCLFVGHLYFAQHIEAFGALLGLRSPGENGLMLLYLILSAANGFLVMGISHLYRKNKEKIFAALKGWLLVPAKQDGRESL